MKNEGLLIFVSVCAQRKHPI